MASNGNASLWFVQTTVYFVYFVLVRGACLARDSSVVRKLMAFPLKLAACRRQVEASIWPESGDAV